MRIRRTKMLRWERRPATSRRVAAATRALRRERDKLPLFADQVASEQPTPEERIDTQEQHCEAWWNRLRDTCAIHWKLGRKMLFAMPDWQDVLARWNDAPYPARSEYFADYMHHCLHDRGIDDTQFR